VLRGVREKEARKPLAQLEPPTRIAAAFYGRATNQLPSGADLLLAPLRHKG